MNCPYCDEIMKKGYINGDRYALKWVEGEHPSFWSFFKKGIKLTRFLENGNSLESYYCEGCNKIIIEVKK
jgi:hypothetical protein